MKLFRLHRFIQWLSLKASRRPDHTKVYAEFQRAFQQQREAARARHGKVRHIDKAQRDALHSALAGGERRR